MTSPQERIESRERNQISQDDLLGYLIQKGIPTHFSINSCGEDTSKDTRVNAVLVLKVPVRPQPGHHHRYIALSMVGQGPTMGHALQSLYDQVEMNVL